MTEIIWKQGKPEEHETFFYKNYYGTDKWKDTMPKSNSNHVLVTVEHNGKRFVDTMCTIDGEWHSSFLNIYNDAKVVAYADYPAPFKE